MVNIDMVALQLLSLPFMLNKGSKEDCVVNKFWMEAENCEVKLFHTEPSQGYPCVNTIPTILL